MFFGQFPWLLILGLAKTQLIFARSSKNFFLKSRGVKGRDTQNVQGVQSNFFNSQGGGQFFRPRKGSRVGLQRLRGASPLSPPLWTHMSLVYNTTQQSLPHHPKGLNYNPVVWPEMGQTKPLIFLSPTTSFVFSSTICQSLRWGKIIFQIR